MAGGNSSFENVREKKRVGSALLRSWGEICVKAREPTSTARSTTMVGEMIRAHASTSVGYTGTAYTQVANPCSS